MASLSYRAERTIRAPVSTVWSVLSDKTQLASGPFGILRLEGNLTGGGKLRLVSELVPNRPFKLTVTAFEPERLMVWRGGMPLGLFTGTRRFALSQIPEGTAFAVEEVFSGLMAGMVTKSMPDLQPSFDQFADALTSIAEENAS